MQNRFSHSPEAVAGMNTEQLRANFLVEDVFVPGEIRLVHSHHDRIVIGGAFPTSSDVSLEAPDEMRADHFLVRRELGVVCVAGQGTVTVDGEAYDLDTLACLYVGRGTADVRFSARSEGGAKFYLFSAPAHTTYPTTLVRPGEGTIRELGDQSTSNQRTLNQYIHEDGVKSCQIVMGVTQLHDGSMWNTMPSHTHDRRTEAYLYFDVPADARIVHLMGEPTQTRHLLVANEQAIISPSWSVHSGVGTRAYSFVWSMAGENQAFNDMDAVPVTEMR